MRKYLNYKNGFWAYVIASLIATILVAEFVLDMSRHVPPAEVCRVLSTDIYEYRSCMMDFNLLPEQNK